MTEFQRRGIRLPPTKTEREAIRALYTQLSEGAIENGKRFRKPDDDWFPVWLVYAPEGLGTLFTGTMEKHTFTKRIAAYTARVGAVAIGHLHSSWGIFHDDGVSPQRMREIRMQMEAQDGSSEGIPERRELLLLNLYSASIWEGHRALIDRHEDSPPTLRPFELFSDEGTLTGPMVTPLRRALVRMG